MERTISEAAEQTTLASRVGQLAAEFANSSAAGELAELRRLDPNRPGSPAFWRIVVAKLDESLPPDGDARVEALRRWAVILRTLAQMAGLHDPHRSLGAGAAEAGVSETRFLKLLRASGETLIDTVRMIAHQLASTATSVNLTDFARLVLSNGRSDDSAVRERIAYGYYAHLRRIEKERI